MADIFSRIQFHDPMHGRDLLGIIEHIASETKSRGEFKYEMFSGFYGTARPSVTSNRDGTGYLKLENGSNLTPITLTITAKGPFMLEHERPEDKEPYFMAIEIHEPSTKDMKPEERTRMKNYVSEVMQALIQKLDMTKAGS